MWKVTLMLKNSGLQKVNNKQYLNKKFLCSIKKRIIYYVLKLKFFVVYTIKHD